MAYNSQRRACSVVVFSPRLAFEGRVLLAVLAFPNHRVGLTMVPTNLSDGSEMINAMPSSASNTATWLAQTRPPSTPYEHPKCA
eukprot:1782576-Amphidinium_carterae.1